MSSAGTSKLTALLCLLLPACNATAPREQPHAKEQPTAAATDSGVKASIATSGVSGHVLLLGRIVDLETMKAVSTVTATAPEYELTLPAENLGLAYWTWGDLQAIDLATGETRWITRPTACSGSTLAATTDYLYAICGSDVAAFRLADGVPSSLGAGPLPFVEFVVNGPFLFARDVTGRVRVWERSAAHKRSADKRVAELAGSTDERGLLAAPSMPGVCVWSLRSGQATPAHRRLDVACYDERLERRWAKTIKLDGARGPVKARFTVAQAGPHHLVLRDELESGEAPRARAQSVIVRWSDGDVATHDSATYATLEHANGERVVDSPALEVFTRQADQRGIASFQHEGAVIAREREQAYLLLKRSAPALAAADLERGRTLFVVQVPENNFIELEVVRGTPIVRFQERNTSYANIYHPLTGAWLYGDGRDQDTRNRAL